MDTTIQLTDEQLADTIRADYEDALLNGETRDVEDYLSWVRAILTGNYRPIESIALPYLEFQYEEATDRVGSLDLEDAQKFIGREVFVRWQAFDSWQSFTLEAAIVTAVDYDDAWEFMVVRDRDGEEIIPLARVTDLRTIDVRRKEI
jgi:hypothetical protein